MSTRFQIAEPDEGQRRAAQDILVGYRLGDPPSSRLEAGLRIAIEWTRRDGFEIDAGEEQRMEFAVARILARQGAPKVEAVDLGSVDHARLLLVDASLQREAEIAMQLDLLDRQDTYSWTHPDVTRIPWVKAESSPTDFMNFADADLFAISEGEFEQISRGQRENVEIMLLRGVNARDDEFERELHQIGAELYRGAAAIRAQDFGASADVSRLQANAEALDLERFSALPAPGGLSAKDMGGVVDRVAMAKLADKHSETSQNLYDARPGRNPFRLSAETLRFAEVTVSKVADGVVTNRTERAARIALEFQKEHGLSIDRAALVRLEGAVARAAADSHRPTWSDLDLAKRLVVDTSMQKAAAEKLAPRSPLGIQKGPSASEKSLELMLGRGNYPVFTRLPYERADTLAVSKGQFQDLTDDRGIGSMVRTALHRSGRDLTGAIGQQFARLEATIKVKQDRDGGWLDRKAGVHRGAEQVRSLSKGPQRELDLGAWQQGRRGRGR
ncbi:hypothetical protein [Sphingosinicella sp. BN140058]|uniref:hypothetical protein n=1 Tax=Sphingosinicella sp. BN140058 TaxID=1892855 RepID=UPI0010131748|nr:hypothetical protein [Sphingosinicella sp. BN140058]QAY80360.1 hypothetical protein ETR14_27350 [Sphingosinicella sp. BN140058]